VTSRIPPNDAPAAPDAGGTPGGRTGPRDEGFRRADRITGEATFRALLGRGFRHSTAHLIVHVLANELGHSRLGLTVPRKVGKAVLRNRVKRRLREAFRRCWRFDLEQKPADVLVRAQPGCGTASFDELLAEGRAAFAAWKRAGYREGGRRPRSSP
jgi:ribonuclease P protein component